jgi:hypothetical protein
MPQSHSCILILEIIDVYQDIVVRDVGDVFQSGNEFKKCTYY